MVYSWKYDKPVAAAVAGARLEQLEKKFGEVTPQIILDDARAEGTPLHRCFEWDDAKAAEGYRLQQARGILTSLVVTVETETKPKYVRAFVNTAPMDRGVKGSFISVMAAMEDETAQRNVLAMALRELRQIEKKYSTLKELANVFKAIRAVKVA